MHDYASCPPFKKTPFSIFLKYLVSALNALSTFALWRVSSSDCSSTTFTTVQGLSSSTKEALSSPSSCWIALSLPSFFLPITSLGLCTVLCSITSSPSRQVCHFDGGIDYRKALYDPGRCAYMAFCKTQITNQRTAFSRHFLTFDLMECSRTFPEDTVQRRNNQSASKESIRLKQPISVRTLTRSLDTISFHRNVDCDVMWCSSWKGRDSFNERVSCRSTSGRCLCLVEREVFFFFFDCSSP